MTLRPSVLLLLAVATSAHFFLLPRPLSGLTSIVQDRADEAPVGAVEHTWTPVRGGDAEVEAIEVRTEIVGLPDSLGRDFTVDAPIVYAGVPGIADRVENLEIEDAEGAVPIRVEDDEPHPGGFPHYRHWRAGRDVTFPVVMTYRSLTPREQPPGPPFGLYAAYGGVSGAGSGFLVLPDLDVPVTSRIRWVLDDLEAGSRAAATFGLGDFEVEGSPGRIRQSWVMVGPLGVYPRGGDLESGFSAFWLGTPTWDPEEEMTWAREVYRYLGEAFGHLDPLPPYRVFIRVGFRSGTALGNSFMGGSAPREPGAEPEGEASRTTIVHELMHMFVGGIEGPQGVTSWFSEGLTTHYTRLLPMRGGFTSVEEYGRQINDAFRSYYTSPNRNLSADSIVQVGFRDSEIRHIPYIRGSLYFADLDAKIRDHSDGSRTLDQVLRELFERRERGDSFDHDVWIETVVREAGPSARKDFQEIILEGTRTLVPASDAFGPCFERRPAPLEGPDGNQMEGYEWVRVQGVPDERCGEW